MEIQEDRWLSARIGRPVFRVEVGDHSGDCETVARHARGQPATRYYAKVATHHVDLVRQLAAVGFYVVDVNVMFDRNAEAQPQAPRRPEPAVLVREVHSTDHEAVLRIAGSCFRYSRFHLDPGLPTIIADRIKRDWISSYVQHRRGDALLVAERNGRVVGFLAAMISEEAKQRIGTIDLIGVDAGCQRQGVGYHLVQGFFDRYRSQCAAFRVGTQAANVPSMRLYEACGFSVWKTTYVLHLHVPPRPSTPTASCESVPSLSQTSS